MLSDAANKFGKQKSSDRLGSQITDLGSLLATLRLNVHERTLDVISPFVFFPADRHADRFYYGRSASHVCHQLEM